MSCSVGFCFFFFKQKTAYEMRISDWSSDVCSSDLLAVEPPEVLVRLVPTPEDRERVSAAARIFEGKKAMHVTSRAGTNVRMPLGQYQIGRASCRERVCQYV